MTTAPVPRHCLWCQATLAQFTGTSTRCPACGRSNSKADLRVYWTRDPGLMTLERLCKLSAVLLTVLLVPLACIPPGGPSSGGLIAIPIAVGWLFWKTAGKLTRHMDGYHSRVVWAAALGLLAPLAIVSAMGRRDLATLGVALAMILGALLAGPVAKRLERWKRERILAGERTWADAEHDRAVERRAQLHRVILGRG